MATRWKEVEKRNDEKIVVDDSAFQALKERANWWPNLVASLAQKSSASEITTAATVAGSFFIACQLPSTDLWYIGAKFAFAVLASAVALHASHQKRYSNGKAEPRNAPRRPRAH